MSVPEYYKTHGPDVGELCTQIGFAPDPEQQLALDVIFAKQASGLSAAFDTTVVVGRQNLKTGTFKMAALGWLFLFDERLIVWSAHEWSTVGEDFRDMEEMVAGTDWMRREVKQVKHGSGNESIQLKTGARLIFKTRTHGGGRGLAGRKVILDEGFALRDAHVGSLVPTLSAQPDPQLLIGSSAGHEDSDYLREKRDEGRAAAIASGTAPAWARDESLTEAPEEHDFVGRSAYLEWCAPPPDLACDAGRLCSHAKNARGCGCDKPDLWLQGNPAIGGRITLDYVAAERKALSVPEFCRERMGWWDDPKSGAAPMPYRLWRVCEDSRSTPKAGSPLALAIDVAPDASMASIALAGIRDDGMPHVELVEHLPGTGWVMGRLMGIVERRNPLVVSLDPGSPAGAFEKQMKIDGFMASPPQPDGKLKLMPSGKRRMHLVSSRDNGQACGAIANAVANDGLRHAGQYPLDEAVKAARSRPLGNAWAWDRGGDADITPLVAVTFALQGLTLYGYQPPMTPFFLSDDDDLEGPTA